MKTNFALDNDIDNQDIKNHNVKVSILKSK